MKGGETTFPRWVNAETFRELKVTPEVGQAVLFYSQLPDGNLDDFSQHAAQPVIEGEKVNEKTLLVCVFACINFIRMLTQVFRFLHAVASCFPNISGYVISSCHIVFCDNFLTLTSCLQLINLWVWADEYR